MMQSSDIAPQTPKPEAEIYAEIDQKSPKSGETYCGNFFDHFKANFFCCTIASINATRKACNGDNKGNDSASDGENSLDWNAAESCGVRVCGAPLIAFSSIIECVFLPVTLSISAIQACCDMTNKKS